MCGDVAVWRRDVMVRWGDEAWWSGVDCSWYGCDERSCRGGQEAQLAWWRGEGVGGGGPSQHPYLR